MTVYNTTFAVDDTPAPMAMRVVAGLPLAGSLTVTNDNGTPFDLTAYTPTMTLVNPDAQTVTHPFTASDNGAGGVIVFGLDAATTLALGRSKWSAHLDMTGPIPRALTLGVVVIVGTLG